MSYLDNIRTFVRVYELGSMSAAGRDLRISPAVTSARISQLEDYLSVRLFQRTTRNLSATEQGRAFYPGAVAVLEAVDEAEAQVMQLTETPRGTLFVAAPLGIGRRLVAPAVPRFLEDYPEIAIRLRLSDRAVDLTTEGLDLAFFLGQPSDSALKMRKIAECSRVLCASPEYVSRRGMPQSGADLVAHGHNCLNLRYPGADEFQWQLETEEGPRRFAVSGRHECDDGDVLTDWAVAGEGVVLKPVFEVASLIASGALVPVAVQTPPVPVQLACLYAHRRHQDPKTRLFLDFMATQMGAAVLSAEQEGSSRA
ncbi:LysR family transcriptional regulator [Epibacterium sp. SM1979]|uniref:LysR family transcriptional regulator n=1 Tax=Tritonibacter litoralis TaxID=2662264 RepID=A0A843YJ50_9RHOB|nr:LysR family transcriptional regulator [Tritonibacter litoralis]MQQ09282.1 LysR family transcriptional regulator [Tritonibacter litoralis]